MTSLKVLDASSNQLTGNISPNLCELVLLRELYIDNNDLRGHIPVEIGTYLLVFIHLNLSRNAFNGSIPSSFFDMKMLKSLDISHNQLTGEIPERMATGCFSLEILALSNNSLQGLYLSDNRLFGRIPRWLGNLLALEDIMMPNNNLQGPIPIEFCQLELLTILDLSNNTIFGTLPSCFRTSSFVKKQDRRTVGKPCGSLGLDILPHLFRRRPRRLAVEGFDLVLELPQIVCGLPTCFALGKLFFQPH
ncbi:hypothetical protein CISIN_1g044683mg, partial [Citrus sinensis]